MGIEANRRHRHSKGMKWECPLCITSQEIPDHRVSQTGWTFSKCARCDQASFLKLGLNSKIQVRSLQKSEPNTASMTLIRTKRRITWDQTLRYLSQASLVGIIVLLVLKVKFHNSSSPVPEWESSQAVATESIKKFPAEYHDQIAQHFHVSPPTPTKTPEAVDAPSAPAESDSRDSSPKVVKLISPKTNLRSGPGMEYDIVARVKSQELEVELQKNDWLKLKPLKNFKKEVWVRNDLVNVVK